MKLQDQRLSRSTVFLDGKWLAADSGASLSVLNPANGEVLGQVYKKPVLWSRTYFVTSCGGAPLSVIKQYIEQQERPE